jgi:hypothetical protein
MPAMEELMRFHGARTLLLALAVPLLAASATVRAGSVDLAVGDESVRASAALPLPGPNLELDFGWLHNDDERDVGTIGLHVAETLGRTEVEATVGVRGYWVEVEDTEDAALALGGSVAAPVPGTDGVLWLGGHGHIAPDASAFGDLEQLYEIGASAEVRLLERAALYLGVRKLRAEVEAGSFTLDDDLHVGVRLRF